MKQPKTFAIIMILVCSSSLLLILASIGEALADYQMSPAQQKQIEEDKKALARISEFDRKVGEITDAEQEGRDAKDADPPDPAKAIPLLKTALEKSKLLYGDDHFQTGWELDMLGDAYAKASMPDEAEECFHQAMIIFGALKSKDREQVYSPAAGLFRLLHGAANGNFFMEKAPYLDWLRRKHANEAERQALMNKLDAIRDHPLDKVSLEPNWGSVPQNSQLREYLSQVQQTINKQWPAAVPGPPKAALLEVSLMERFPPAVAVLEKSGSDAFDAAAQTAVKATKKYPLPTQRTKIMLEIPFGASGAGIPYERFNN